MLLFLFIISSVTTQPVIMAAAAAPDQRIKGVSRLEVGMLVGIAISILVVLTVIALKKCCCLRRTASGNRLEPHFEVAAAAELGSSSFWGQHNVMPDFEPRIGESVVAEAAGATKNISLRQLCRATNNFSPSLKLGEGSYGVVYMGQLSDPPRTVAVKKFKNIDDKNIKDFEAESDILSNLEHPNLVRLEGCCFSKENGALLLVYEYVPNGTLKNHLNLLSLADKFKIACGIASGLEYLHHGGKLCVIHRDIKPENIMLEEDLTPKIGDFGLARKTEHDRSMRATAPAGSRVYTAPEIRYLDEKATKWSDVYSFGIVLLQLATGRQPYLGSDEGHLFNWVWNFHGQGNILQAVDNMLQLDEFDMVRVKCLLVVGLWCCQPNPRKRPQMQDVIQVLNHPAELPDVPCKPDWSVIYPESRNLPATRGIARSSNWSSGIGIARSSNWSSGIAQAEADSSAGMNVCPTLAQIFPPLRPSPALPSQSYIETSIGDGSCGSNYISTAQEEADNSAGMNGFLTRAQTFPLLGPSPAPPSHSYVETSIANGSCGSEYLSAEADNSDGTNRYLTQAKTSPLLRPFRAPPSQSYVETFIGNGSCGSNCLSAAQEEANNSSGMNRSQTQAQTSPLLGPSPAPPSQSYVETSIGNESCSSTYLSTEGDMEGGTHARFSP